MKNKTIIILTLIIVCAFSRLIPHMPNFTPYIGVALLGGAILKDMKWAILTPVLALFLSDLLINNTIARIYFTDVTGFVWWSPYMTFNLICTILFVLMGRFLLPNPKGLNVVGVSLLAACAFFLISNFGVWMTSEVAYPKTFVGLMACYTAGIPFFKGTAISAVVVSSVLFGVYNLVSKFANVSYSNTQQA